MTTHSFQPASQAQAAARRQSATALQALLLRMHPEVVANIDRIVFMGGAATIGNATAVAEFNVWHDPEAAAAVTGSGGPCYMYGLDVVMAGAILGALHGEAVVEAGELGVLDGANRLDLMEEADRFAAVATEIFAADAREAAERQAQRDRLLSDRAAPPARAAE